jgi:DNA gyrase subunit A
LADETSIVTPPPPPPPSENGVPRNPPLDIERELQDSYLTYAMSVIVSRALPDVRDGLKPSQRRILVAMHDLGLNPSSSTSKCAAIVGETMKRYHPHGDASIYDSLVRMAQDWVLRYRLVHGQGNFGSIAGLPAAAHRYTEARLTPLAGEMLEDLDRETVDFIDNYDGKYREPLVLPCKVPNLLVNGSDGIAVGMATEIPPHNLKEVTAGLIALIGNPDMTLQELMQYIPGPDFPTGGIIMGRQGIVDGYATGRGKITLRARAEIIEDTTPCQIVISEVPFQQTRNRLAEEIGRLVREERIKDIAAMRDESSARNGEPVRLVIDLKRNANADLVLNQLYEFSSLQKTVSIILLALVDGRPRVLSIKEMMQEFLKHRASVIRRRTEFLLREAKRRGHVLEGQLIAISSMDEVIRICRTASNRQEAKVQLQRMQVAASVLQRAIGDAAFQSLQHELGTLEAYQMTEAQSEAIVRMQLGQLAALERDEIYKEFSHIREQIVSYEILLGSETNIYAVIQKDLEEVRDKYGDVRKTDFAEAAEDLDFLALIADEDQIFSITQNGYIKRIPLTQYKTQHRGTKGVAGGVKDEDFAEHFFIASTHSYLLLFTNFGQCYWLRGYQAPEVKNRTQSGKHINNVLARLRPEERISSVIPLRSFEGEFSLLMATKKGIVKKTTLADYSRPKQGGIIGINLREGDSLISVCLTQPGEEVVLSSRNGMAIRFAESDARSMGRNTSGVKGINLSKDDELVGMVVADPEGYLLTISENGFGKRTPFGPNTVLANAEDDSVVEEVPEPEPEVSETETGESDDLSGDNSNRRYRRQKRGGKGVRDIQTSARNGKVVGILPVKETDDVLLITVQGMVNRTHVSEIGVKGRNTQGVRIMNLNEGDKIASMAKVTREETVEENSVSNPPSTEEPAS